MDLFPKDMCEQLEHLQSSAPAHSFGYTKSVIERSLGMPIHELFDSFEEEALASGSIGQVRRDTRSPPMTREIARVVSKMSSCCGITQAKRRKGFRGVTQTLDGSGGKARKRAIDTETGISGGPRFIADHR